MSVSSRTAIADGRKKITIASSHRTRLAGPIRPAVVSQRSPTIAVMLKSTTSRSVSTRGSRGRGTLAGIYKEEVPRSGGGRMQPGHQPPHAAAHHGARGDVGGKVLVGADP